MAYFERLGPDSFRATEHTGGAWRTDEQHIAPALGLLAHLVEADRDRRRDQDGRERLALARLSYDILGTVPIDVVRARVRVVRPGRTIELVEAVLSHAGRDVVLLRAWLLQTRPTGEWQGSALPQLPAPETMPRWDPTTVWPGGFVATADVRRKQAEPGRALFWVRTSVPLLAGERVSRLAGVAGLLDITNGMTVREDPRDIAFPNIDLTAHFFAEPAGEWIGFDTTVTFGADGLGVTHSIVHDERGPIGTSAQSLTLRPIAARG